MSDQLYDAWDDACNRVRELEQQLADANRRIEYLELCDSEATKQLAAKDALIREAMSEQKTYCGNHIAPQFGASHTCAPDDWQCSSCHASDLEKESDAKQEHIEELEQQLADANRRIEYLELCDSEAEQQLSAKDALIREAFNEGFRSVRTYNDTVLNSEDDAWEDFQRMMK